MQEREWTGLNRRPLVLQSNALPLSYTPFNISLKFYSLMNAFFSKSKTKEWNVQVLLVLKTNNLDFYLKAVTCNNADSLMNAWFFFQNTNNRQTMFSQYDNANLRNVFVVVGRIAYGKGRSQQILALSSQPLGQYYVIISGLIHSMSFKS